MSFSYEQEFQKYANLFRNRKSENMVDPLQALNASRAAIDWMKLLHNYAEEVKDVQKRGELMRIIGHLSLELAETQIKLSEQIRNNQISQERISELEKEIQNLKSPEEELDYRNGAYYDSIGDGPFCTGCYDGKRQKVRLAELPRTMRSIGLRQCPVCKSTF